MNENKVLPKDLYEEKSYSYSYSHSYSDFDLKVGF